ncbi:MAG TPA: hypothetical protein VGR35_07675 [Tepidisphaeraceae bacterium]|nr:hypothetical protein [Tepidisphaeraceae bacterium]
MDVALRHQLKPGATVKVIQQIAARDYTLTSEIRGTVVAYEQEPTGSWFAHSKNDKLWLDRLTLRKDDGELTTLNLDSASHVEVQAPDAPAVAGEKTNESELPV